MSMGGQEMSQEHEKCLHLRDKQEEMEPAKEMGILWGELGKAIWYYATESKEEQRKGSAVDTGEPLDLETKKSLVSKKVISMKWWSLKAEDKRIIEWVWGREVATICVSWKDKKLAPSLSLLK